ncbi:MAG TPA: hypothetical protein HPP90_05235 [Deltaproteobacteria bacterium]|nr:hypothetical protein [Deltaproteobacteria bacterium]
MATSILLERTQELLRYSVPGEQDLDGKVRQLIKAECMRQLARYRRVDMDLTRKYGVSFDEFLKRRIARQMNFTWEVEQDGMEWETAIGGMQTVERKLNELRADQ